MPKYIGKSKGVKGIFLRQMASGGGLTNLITVFKYRKIKLLQGNNFIVSSALVIKLKILDLCLTVKN